MHLMINNSLSINICLTKEFEMESSERTHKTVKFEGEHTHQSAYPTLGGIGGSENGHLTLLTIADKEEMIDLLVSMNSSGSDTGLMTPYFRGTESVRRSSFGETLRSSVSPRGGLYGGERGSAYDTSTAATDDANSAKYNSTANIGNSNGNSSSSASSPYPRCTYRMHPDLEDLLSALDPTVSLEDLSVTLEQPLREVRASVSCRF